MHYSIGLLDKKSNLLCYIVTFYGKYNALQYRVTRLKSNLLCYIDTFYGK